MRLQSAEVVMMTTAAVLAAVGLVAGELPTAAPLPASKPKADGLIAVNCGDHLRLLNEAGREVKRYTPPIADGWPAWQVGPVSPDLKRLILTARVELGHGYTRTVIAPLDGKGRLRPILPPGDAFYDPFWAADGKRLIDGRHVYDGVFGVNSHCANLTFEVNSGRVELLPLPAIEGGPPEKGVEWFGLTDPAAYRRSLHRVVACSRTGDWYLTIYHEQGPFSGHPPSVALVSKDGKTVRRVLDTDHVVTGAAFSPSGTRAVLTVWSRSLASGNFDCFDGIYVLDVKDAGLKRVVAPSTDTAGFGRVRAAWSPDGERLALGFHRLTNDGEFEFRVMSYTPDGGDPRPVLSVIGTRDEISPLCLDGWY